MIETTKPEVKASVPASAPVVKPKAAKPTNAKAKKPTAPTKLKPDAPAKQKIGMRKPYSPLIKKLAAKKAKEREVCPVPEEAKQEIPLGILPDAPPKKPIFRSDSVFALAFDRLMTGQEFDLMTLFGGLTTSNGAPVRVADPARMLQYIIRRGEFSGQFRVERTAPGMVQMKVFPKV